MHPLGPVYSADVDVGAWIAPRLTGEVGSVGNVVPTGFEAYARLLHPVEVGDGLLRWADVAADTGRIVHPLVQWHQLSGVGDAQVAASGNWSNDEPSVGELHPNHLASLLDVLGRHTGTAEDCWFGVWDGYGWEPGSSLLVSFRIPEDGDPPDLPPPPPPEPGPPAFTSEQLAGPRVETPMRNYLLLHGPLGSARFVGHHATPDWFLEQSPNLCWPADRAWCVGTEIDFDSTLVAGSRGLIDELLASADLEVFEVDPADSLAVDGDTVN